MARAAAAVSYAVREYPDVQFFARL